VSRRVRIGAVVAGLVALTAAATAGFLAGHAGAASPATYTASAAMKATAGSKGKGVFTGTVSSSVASSGKLSWKLTYSGLSGRVTGVQLRQGTKILARLCIVACSSGVHRTQLLGGSTFTAVKAGKTTVTVATRAHSNGELIGALKLKAAAGGGGGGTLTVAVTPAAIAAGKKAATKYSCTGCHTISGAKSTGPTWKGLAGSTVHLIGGGTTTATDSYLVDVITNPSDLKVAGFDPGVMQEAIPAGLVSDAEAKAIVAYIKSLK
jgi:cytochrome c1